MREVLIIISCVLFGVTFGFVIGSVNDDFIKTTWNGELNWEPFLNILIAIVIAVFLSQSFQRFLDTKKIENLWVMEPYKESVKLLREMKLDFESTYKARLPRKEMLDRFRTSHRKFANCLTEAEDLLNLTGHNSEKSTCKELQMKSILYKAVVTNGNPNEAFDNLDSAKHDKNFNALRKELFQVIISLGRK